MPIALDLKSAALSVALVAALVLGGAYVLEYGFGLEPCPLCLEQRIPYFVGIPAAVLAGIVAAHSNALAAALLGLVAVTFAVGLGLGIYHSGVEWHWWPGPSACAGGAPGMVGSVEDLMNAIEDTEVIRCDEAPWRLFGLSLAGYNALASLAFVAVSVTAVLRYRSGMEGTA